MRISASVHNSTEHFAIVETDGIERVIAIPAKESGRGSSVNGGELLMLALATCYCNDLFREATRLGIEISKVRVAASADFLGVGLAAENIRYSVAVLSSSPSADIDSLIAASDQVAEIHNTIRSAIPVTLEHQAAG
ncbi:OsmC family protein [Solilutibacter tolerans]|uniref:Uncharacterized OsmC-related protein n=1 Tax=Solilutibacter tolerans TaxID=1604334 RepID=A0A1N6YMV2_9GAMM|nr:OsmC family protein [Lysobacter tolerans]SIR15943.1 Uncharacterized OsmC-related protein [Lysobacter tolerans]